MFYIYIYITTKTRIVVQRLLRVPWTARRSNQSILKEINPKYSLEGLILKLKLQTLEVFIVKAMFVCLFFPVVMH